MHYVLPSYTVLCCHICRVLCILFLVVFLQLPVLMSFAYLNVDVCYNMSVCYHFLLSACVTSCVHYVYIRAVFPVTCSVYNLAVFGNCWIFPDGISRKNGTSHSNKTNKC